MIQRISALLRPLLDPLYMVSFIYTSRIMQTNLLASLNDNQDLAEQLWLPLYSLVEYSQLIGICSIDTSVTVAVRDMRGDCSYLFGVIFHSASSQRALNFSFPKYFHQTMARYPFLHRTYYREQIWSRGLAKRHWLTRRQASHVPSLSPSLVQPFSSSYRYIHPAPKKLWLVTSDEPDSPKVVPC